MQFKVITGVISALFLLFALLQLAMGGYVAGLFFLIGAIFFLPPIQAGFKERLDRPVYLSSAIGLGLVLTMVGFVFANKPGEPNEENKTMIVHNSETYDTTNPTETDALNVEGGTIQVDPNPSEREQAVNGTQNIQVETTQRVNEAQNPEVVNAPVNSEPATRVETQTRVQNPPPKAVATAASAVPPAGAVKTQAPVNRSTPVPLKTLKPSPLNTPSSTPTPDFSQEANAMFEQLDSFLQIGQSMQADRQSDNPAAIAACQENMKNTLTDAQATKRASDLLVEKTRGLNLDKYKKLQQAATEMTSCVTCDKNRAENACQKAQTALKEYTQQVSQ